MKNSLKSLGDYLSAKRQIISISTGRPSPKLTDEIWQTEFNELKTFVTPYCKNIKILGGRFSKDSGIWNGESQGDYYGNTNWQTYCSYINDVLRNIRNGNIDYCYYIVQIADLLKFHFDDLKTRYCDGYWEVWLEQPNLSEI